ncbi:MAG: hypothetical protein ABGZ35_21760 [Planctomycetaceae bacterium]
MLFNVSVTGWSIAAETVVVARLMPALTIGNTVAVSINSTLFIAGDFLISQVKALDVFLSAQLDRDLNFGVCFCTMRDKRGQDNRHASGESVVKGDGRTDGCRAVRRLSNGSRN